MYFLTSLIIFLGLVFAFFFGLVKVLWSLSGTSVHVSPKMLEMPHGGASGTEEEHSNATAAYETNPTEYPNHSPS
jgi:hypothetical protein